MIPLLELLVINPTQSLAFLMTEFTAEKSKKLENLGTVMTLYSRRTFSKESFQWTKCVVKYLWDTYSHLSLQMLAFLVEVLEKGAPNLQLAVLSILHCMLYYVELNAPAAQPVNADLLRVVAKFIDDGTNYREAMKILKLVVTRCSTLVVPPYWDSHASSILDTELHGKKELPGRTMDFTFDLSQTPVIGRKYLPKAGGSQPASQPSSLSNASTTTLDKGSSTSQSGSASTVVGGTEAATNNACQPLSAASPRRSLSLSPADALAAGWKRPWMCQSRVRECLVNLLTTCGQRVGLPKSPSVIFSQSSELLERESSMASSLEEVSGTPGNEPSGGAPPTDHFGVFKDFDFLEYESESIEGESSDNFNWGVRRRLLSEERDESHALERSPPRQPRKLDTPLQSKLQNPHEDSSDEEAGWDEAASGSRGEGDDLALRPRTHSFSSASSGEPDGDRGDVTPVPHGTPAPRDAWRASVAALLRHAALLPPLALVHRLHTALKEVTCKTVSLCSEWVSVGGGAGELSAVLERLAAEEPPLLWAGAAAADCPRVTDAVRYAALEITEHLETYFDRREHAIETLELSRGMSEEVGRCLYKLIFQLLLLLETNNKMVVAVYHAALENRGVEMSAAVCAVRAALLGSAGDSWGEHSPAPHTDQRLLSLMQRQRYLLLHSTSTIQAGQRGGLVGGALARAAHRPAPAQPHAATEVLVITFHIHHTSWAARGTRGGSTRPRRTPTSACSASCSDRGTCYYIPHPPYKLGSAGDSWGEHSPAPHTDQRLLSLMQRQRYLLLHSTSTIQAGQRGGLVGGALARAAHRPAPAQPHAATEVLVITFHIHHTSWAARGTRGGSTRPRRTPTSACSASCSDRGTCYYIPHPPYKLGSAGDSWGEHSPAPHTDQRLLSLMQRQRWGAALSLVRERNAERILERGELPEDDVTSLLHVYCKALAQAHPEMVAITRPVNELSQNLSFMMESLYKVSVALQRQEYG
ncbi:protein furry [Phthorimaea operculella]|nr:protein furry [Phthorimaea operculella]